MRTFVIIDRHLIIERFGVFDIPRNSSMRRREDLIDGEVLDMHVRDRMPRGCKKSRAHTRGALPSARAFFFFRASSHKTLHLSPASSFTLELVYCWFPAFSRKLVCRDL